MQRKWIRSELVLLAVAAALACGCKKKESKPGQEKKPGPADKGKTAKAGEPRPDPAARKGAGELAFPELKPVPPPKDLKEKLDPIEKKLADKDWKVRREARGELYKLVDAHKKHAGLAKYLAMHKNRKFVEMSFRLFKELKDDPATESIMRALMKHPSDSVRGKVLNFFWIQAPQEMVKKLKPYFMYLMKDPSCVIRTEAMRVLTTHRRSLDLDLEKLAAEALKDDCPGLIADGAKNLSGKKADKAITDRLLSLAEKSPLYQIRCLALQALGRLKVKSGETLMAKALTVEASTAMTLYYVNPRSPYTYNILASTMPACAARALSLLHGQPPPKEPLEEVRHWLGEMSKTGRAPKPAKRLCIDPKHCKEKAEVCLNMQCVPCKRAVAAYWRYVKNWRCLKKPKDPPYANWVEPARVLTGFGLHFMGDWRVKEFLQKKNRKAHDEKYSAILRAPCVPE